MATCLPRQKLFGSTSSTSTTFLFLLLSTLSLWIIYTFCGALIVLAPVPVTGEVLLDPAVDSQNPWKDLERVPRSIIQLDSDDYSDGSNNVNINANPFYNPAILEEAMGKGRNLDGYESLRQLSLQSAQPFIRRKLFNTSVALTVPMFSFTLPQKAPEGSTVDLANQAIFGLFALLTSMLVFAVPVVLTGIRPFDVYGRSNNGKSTQNILDNLMKAGESSTKTVNLMGTDLKNKIGLDPEQCLQKTICDAHRYPKNYGLFSLPFQLFFPPPSPDSKKSKKSFSIYQQAAETGEYKREFECWEKYNCFFDIMDLAMYLVNFFNPSVY